MGLPVVRELVRRAVLPDIIVVIGIVSGLQCLLEPFMLVRGVVHHQVHQQLHAPAVESFQKPVKVLHSAEGIQDLFVILDVVAVVHIGRIIDRADPNHINAQVLQVIQSGQNTTQVPNAVMIAVLKAAGVNLVNDRFFPPSCLHRPPPFALILSKECAILILLGITRIFYT